MNIEGKNPDTGEVYQTDDNSVDQDFIDWSSESQMSEAKVKSIIENLDVSADIKSLLFSVSKATIKAGQFVIKIGRKIIDYICKLFTEYPNSSFGMILGAIAGFLIAAIPILGAVLGPLIKPILIAFGLLGGLKEDLKDKALVRKIAEINGQFSPLHG